MQETIKLVHHEKKDALINASPFTVKHAQTARSFHSTFPGYAPTPLAELDTLAETLGIAGMYVKDESYRFGLNAFKGLGGSYSLGKCRSPLLRQRPGKKCQSPLPLIQQARRHRRSRSQISPARRHRRSRSQRLPVRSPRRFLSQISPVRRPAGNWGRSPSSPRRTETMAAESPGRRTYWVRKPSFTCRRAACRNVWRISAASARKQRSRI